MHSEIGGSYGPIYAPYCDENIYGQLLCTQSISDGRCPMSLSIVDRHCWQAAPIDLLFGLGTLEQGEWANGYEALPVSADGLWTTIVRYLTNYHSMHLPCCTLSIPTEP